MASRKLAGSLAAGAYTIEQTSSTSGTSTAAPSSSASGAASGGRGAGGDPTPGLDPPRAEQ
jgi:hypothetical protein